MQDLGFVNSFMWCRERAWFKIKCDYLVPWTIWKYFPVISLEK